MAFGAIAGAIAGPLISNMISGGSKSIGQAGGINAAYTKEALERSKPYSDVGTAALTDLASWLGITGYRPGDQAATTTGEAPVGYERQRLMDKLDVLQGRIQDMPDIEQEEQEEITMKRRELERERARLRQQLNELPKDGPATPIAPSRTGSTGDPVQDRMAMLEATPGYQFRMQQSEKAIKRNLSGTGRTGSLLEQLLSNAQGLASQSYESHLDRLTQVSGIGQAAAAQQAATLSGAGQTAAAIPLYQQQSRNKMFGDIASGLGQVDWGSITAPVKKSVVDKGFRG